MGNPKGNIPWNKGKHGIYTEETKRRIGEAASKRNKGRQFTTIQRQKISTAKKKIKICSACSIKSKWVYNVRMPFTEYVVQLCDADLVSQYYALSLEGKKKVEIIQ